jgi:ClpA/ClpB-like protein
VLTLAQEEAQRFNHNYIGTEHLLLGLVREGDGVAARVLTNLGVRLAKVRDAVEFIIGRGEGLVVGEIGLTPRAKKVIALAVEEARRLNHHYIGTEHLLLGLVREGEGIAAGVLESLGVSLERARREVMQIINRSGGYGSSRTLEVDEPALHTLLDVLPIVQTQQADRIEITLLSLERYDDGFVVNLRLATTDERVRLGYGFLVPPAEASDDRGGHYKGRSCGGGQIRRQERLSLAFQPALDAASRELRLDLPRISWPMVGVGQQEEQGAGPWTFTVTLPPMGEGEPASG